MAPKNVKKSPQPLSRKTMKKTRGGLLAATEITTEVPAVEGQATGKRQHLPYRARLYYD